MQPYSQLNTGSWAASGAMWYELRARLCWKLAKAFGTAFEKGKEFHIKSFRANRIHAIANELA